MSYVLPSCYLPPISYYLYLKTGEKIEVEYYENYQKQTFRNRCQILGANGVLDLIIPIQHDGNRLMKDLCISYAENWQKNHWKSLQSAYQRSPFFEYYEDKWWKLFSFQPKYLIDWNNRCLETTLSILNWQIQLYPTTEYNNVNENSDKRAAFSPKKEAPINLIPYSQVFSDRFQFQKNLSIFDLICNLGPESNTYLINNINKLNK